MAECFEVIDLTRTLSDNSDCEIVDKMAKWNLFPS